MFPNAHNRFPIQFSCITHASKNRVLPIEEVQGRVEFRNRALVHYKNPVIESDSSQSMGYAQSIDNSVRFRLMVSEKKHGNTHGNIVESVTDGILDNYVRLRVN